MTTITQEPVNIGPIPRCIRADEPMTWAVLASALVFVFAMKWMVDRIG